jgi:hypothetical protein
LSSLFRRAGAEGVRASATSCITCSWCSMSAMQRVGGPCGAHSNVRIVERPAQPSPRVQSWQLGLCPLVSHRPLKAGITVESSKRTRMPAVFWLHLV